MWARTVNALRAARPLASGWGSCSLVLGGGSWAGATLLGRPVEASTLDTCAKGAAATEEKQQQQQQQQQTVAPGPGLGSGRQGAGAGRAHAQRRFEEGVAYSLYGPSGPMTLDHLVSSLLQQQVDVLLVGEFHDDPVAHCLQLHLLTKLQQACSGGQSPTGPVDSATTCRHQHDPSTDTSTSGTGTSTSSGTSSGTSTSRLGQLEGQQGGEGRVLAPGSVLAPPGHPPGALAPPGVPGGARRQLVLSFEQFETDVQDVMDEYLADLISEQDLVRDARAWPNYLQDYRPLVQLAKQQGLVVLCANAPRRYVRMAGKGKLQAPDLLLPPSRQLLPPLPVAPPSPAYKHAINRLMQQAQRPEEQQQQQQQQHSQQAVGEPAVSAKQNVPPSQAPPGPGPGDKDCPYVGLNLGDNFYAAQNLWDASMAFSISKVLLERSRVQPDAGTGTPGADGSGAVDLPSSSSGSGSGGPLVVHVCGAMHCEHGLGIPEHLHRYVPGVKVAILLIKPTTNLPNIAQQDFASTLLFVQAKLDLNPNLLATDRSGKMQQYWAITDGAHQRSFSGSG